MQLRSLLLFTLLLVGFGSRPALALDCVDPWSRVDRYDTIVKATVTSAGWFRAELQVETYYKGAGPARLATRFEGYGDLKRDWINKPEVGKTYLIGFINRDGELVNMPCDLFTAAAPQSEARLGQGHPPDPTAPAHRPPFPWLSVTGGAAILLGAGLALMLRRRSNL